MKKQITYLAVLGVLILILCMQQCKISNLKTDMHTKELNLNALNDTISVKKNKLGQLQYEKSVLISTASGLKDLDANLSKEVNAQKGTIAYLQAVNAAINTDHETTDITPRYTPSIDATGKIVAPSCDSALSFNLPWRADKQFDTINFKKLAGVTKFTIKNGIITKATSQVDEDLTSFNIVTGLEKVKESGKPDHYEIFIRSGYPGFKPTKIDGAFIPQKDLFPPQANHHWVFGPTFSIGYGATNTGVGSFFGVGLGISYKLFSF